MHGFVTDKKDFALPLTELAETSFTLPARYYLDPEIYEREKTQIFYRTWQYVAHVSSFESPGDYVTLQICDQNIFVIKGRDDVLRGFYNVCRHRAHELLSQPSGNVRSVIVCPYHAWAYEREGGLRGARFSDQRPGFDKNAFGLREIRLEVFLDCVFVNLDDDAEPLSSQAADLEADIGKHVPYLGDLRAKDLDLGRLGKTVQDAGWKVVVDNYVECYHCKHAHPDFSSLICMEDYQTATGPLWSRQLGMNIRNENSAYTVNDDAPVQNSAFWYLWPNTTFNVLPGAAEMAVFAVRPRTIAQSSFEGHILAVPDASPRSSPSAREAYTAAVLGPEDIALCESVQRGLRSKGYDQGPIMAGDGAGGEGEMGIHHFHRLVHAALS